MVHRGLGGVVVSGWRTLPVACFGNAGHFGCSAALRCAVLCCVVLLAHREASGAFADTIRFPCGARRQMTGSAGVALDERCIAAACTRAAGQQLLRADAYVCRSCCTTTKSAVESSRAVAPRMCVLNTAVAEQHFHGCWCSQAWHMLCQRAWAAAGSSTRSCRPAAQQEQQQHLTDQETSSPAASLSSHPCHSCRRGYAASGPHGCSTCSHTC